MAAGVPNIPRHTNRGLAAAWALAIALACSAAHGDASRIILATLPHGRKLAFRCEGAGGPTVVFEAGWGADSTEWERVQALVSRSRRACAYDRAGYGLSDPGPLPRDGSAIVADLEAGLRSARIPGPYILVGHSAGGLYMRLFAARHPRQVAALVLVDPSVEHQDVRFAQAFGPGAGDVSPLRERAQRCLEAARAKQLPSADPALAACTPVVAGEASAQTLRPGFWAAQLSEIETLFASTSDEVARESRDLGSTPLVVLTAGGRDAAASATPSALLWIEMHREIAARSLKGSERLVEGSTHMMMFDRPDAIVSAIDDAAAAAAGSLQ